MAVTSTARLVPHPLVLFGAGAAVRASYVDPALRTVLLVVSLAVLLVGDLVDVRCLFVVIDRATGDFAVDGLG